MTLDYKCVTEGGCGVVPTDESTSTRNCGDAYDGIRPGRRIDIGKRFRSQVGCRDGATLVFAIA